MIKILEERETVQKKTFTKWVNSHLVHVNCRINDLYVDMRDGKNLIKLLEILSGERLPKPTKGKMRIHCLENVDKALQFLRDQRVHLENIGAHDIVDFSRPSVRLFIHLKCLINVLVMTAKFGSHLDNYLEIPNSRYHHRRS